MQFGWWRIIDPEDLKALLKVLHLRGIREKALQKQIQKHLDYITQACIKNKDGMDLKETSTVLLSYKSEFFYLQTYFSISSFLVYY